MTQQRIFVTLTCPTCDGQGETPIDQKTFVGAAKVSALGGGTMESCQQCRGNRPRGRVEEEWTAAQLRAFVDL